MDDLDILFLIFNFLITLFVFMIVPVSLYIWKNEIKEGQPKKITTINSIVGIIIFIILSIFFNSKPGAITLAPAFFYGYINYKLLNSRVKKEVYKYPNEEQENEELNRLINKLEKDKK